MNKTISDLIEVKNPRVAGRYLKKKVAIGNFIEDYIDEKVNIKVSFMELLKYKYDIFTFNFAAPHYYFFISRMIPEVIIHSQKQDKRIIKSHYDNKNDLFSWFLGTKMIYTSCYFKNLDESLEDAQENKMNLIAQKMQLKEGEELLDIGCGWGTLVAHMAKHYRVNATGVTIAQAGADWATKQIKEYGVEDRAKILTMDYRDIPTDKKYNKIACLEMAEHVGIKYFKKFMKQCYDLLEDDGLFYIQIAGLRERSSLLQKHNREDLIWGLFMNKYIFSGADASMPLNWDLQRIEKVGFEVHSVENIGNHYSITINRWLDNWLSNKEKVLEKYGERIFRIYEIFLAWSVIIGRHGGSTAYQILCHKNMDKFDRTKFIGATNLGEHDEFKKTTELGHT